MPHNLNEVQNPASTPFLEIAAPFKSMWMGTLIYQFVLARTMTSGTSQWDQHFPSQLNKPEDGAGVVEDDKEEEEEQEENEPLI